MPYENFFLEAKLLTPLFMSGANQEEAEFRVASIKGALRFWWRATHAEADYKSLNAIQILFGFTSNDFSTRFKNLATALVHLAEHLSSFRNSSQSVNSLASWHWHQDSRICCRRLRIGTLNCFSN
jgi:CRISPR/Cas system CMR-associated protein Cmr1 (group 7 of RAMP superfamily)